MRQIHICEVGPRDGLQNAHHLMPTEAKKAWIASMAAAGSAMNSSEKVLTNGASASALLTVPSVVGNARLRTSMAHGRSYVEAGDRTVGAAGFSAFR